MIQEVPLRDFGQGLNLRDQPAVVSQSQAVDAINVEHTFTHAVKQRAGYARFTGSALTNRVDSLAAFYKSDGTKQLVAGAGTRLEALNTSGAAVASATGLFGGPYGFVRYGQPNTEVLYAGNGVDTLRKWTGAAWSAPTATVDGTGSRTMPKARYLTVQTPDNRLVATGFSTTTGGPNGATSSPSHVYFSDEGNPESWTTNNSIQLRPGDGEAIQGAVTFNGAVYVFKNTAIWQFYGNSTDAEGNPVFNDRGMEGGIGLDSPRALCVGRDGIYFMSRKGIYRLRGYGQPDLLSDVVRPIFYGGASEFFRGGVLNQAALSACAMWWHDERIYLAYPSGTSTTNDRLLVYDIQQEWWGLYDIPAAAGCDFRISSQDEMVFAYPTGTNDVGRHSASYTSDDGSAIQSRWKSGWADFNLPRIKKVKRAKVSGTGKVRMGIATDYGFAESTNPLDFSGVRTVWGGFTWGSATWGGQAIATVPYQHSHKGQTFSVELTNTVLDQPWAVHSLAFHLSVSQDPANVNVYS